MMKQQYLGLRGPSLSHAIGVVSGLCFFMYGYGQGVMGGFLTIKSFNQQFPQQANLSHPNDLSRAIVNGFTVAIWNVGCFCSAMLTVFLGDRLGRKKLMYAGLTFLLIGEIIQCASFAWGQFLAGRFIAGFGNGFNCATVPAWMAECSKSHRRGTLLMISAGACIAAGLSFSYWMDFGFAYLDPSSAAWRAPLAIQMVFIFFALGLLYFMPESPRWLILQGREGEALQVLSALNDLEPEDNDIHQEFLQIKDAVVQMSQATVSNIFRMGDYRDLHRVILAVVLQFFQQIGGINFMTQYFGTMFMAQYKWGGWQARLLASSAGTVFFIASFFAVWAIDRVTGRRGLMLLGTSGMLVSMIILTIMLWGNTRATLDAGTAFVFIFTSFYAIGWQGMSWLYQVEIVPLRIRGPANALSTASNWLANIIVVLIEAPAFTSLKWKTYLIFVATNAMILPVIYFFYPETGLRCLEEIDYIFHTANSSPHPWLDVKKIAANEPLWYGRDSEDPYDYEASEWHQRHVRFSDEVKDSEGETTTLRPSESGLVEKLPSGSGSSGSVTQASTPPDERPHFNGDLVPPPPVANPGMGRSSENSGRSTRDTGRRM